MQVVKYRGSCWRNATNSKTFCFKKGTFQALVVIFSHCLLALVSRDGHDCRSGHLKVTKRCVGEAFPCPHVVDILCPFYTSQLTELEQDFLNRRYFFLTSSTRLCSNWLGSETLLSLVVMSQELLSRLSFLCHVLELAQPTPNIPFHLAFRVSLTVDIEFNHNV